MLKFNPMKNLYEGPLPPMALTDYETMSKFLDLAVRRCRESGRDFNLFLDWAIHTLTVSLTADSASRIFVPKTKTAPFQLEDLLPLPEVRPSGQRRLQLNAVNLIAPVWNNSELESAIESFYDSGFADTTLEKTLGIYIEELNLAILDTPNEVDMPYVLRVWGRGSVQLDCYSLKDLAPLLDTDGENWYIQERDGGEQTLPVLEPRMAALYNCALNRYVPKA